MTRVTRRQQIAAIAATLLGGVILVPGAAADPPGGPADKPRPIEMISNGVVRVGNTEFVVTNRDLGILEWLALRADHLAADYVHLLGAQR